MLRDELTKVLQKDRELNMWLMMNTMETNNFNRNVKDNEAIVIADVLWSEISIVRNDAKLNWLCKA